MVRIKRRHVYDVKQELSTQNENDKFNTNSWYVFQTKYLQRLIKNW